MRRKMTKPWRNIRNKLSPAAQRRIKKWVEEKVKTIKKEVK